MGKVLQYLLTEYTIGYTVDEQGAHPVHTVQLNSGCHTCLGAGRYGLNPRLDHHSGSGLNENN